MGLFKDIWNGEHKSFVRYACVATVVFVVAVELFEQNNIVRWIRSGIELRQQRHQIERYHQEIGEMNKKIDMLSTNKDSLEQFARENFHFAAPGEDVYLDNSR